jgi:thioredoxin reductase (NADPH)
LTYEKNNHKIKENEYDSKRKDILMMYDVIIIGAGPAGISASLYTQRANQKTLILYHETSNLEKAVKIDNYYGFSQGVSGEELYETGIKQAENLGVEVKKEEVIKVGMTENGFQISTTKQDYQSKTVIIALGNKKKQVEIKGIKELEGKGVSYCAICDGFFYRGKKVAVLGNGNYALAETNELLAIADQITILTNGEKAPEFRANNVEINTKPIQEIKGENRVREVRFQDDTSLEMDGIFVAQGVAGGTELAKKLGILTKQNTIVVNEKMETNIPGIYACGDCTGGLLQVCKAVYEGATAGLQAIQYVRNKSKN